MEKISSNIIGFKKALDEGKPLRVTSEGEFYLYNTLGDFVLKLFFGDEGRWIEVSRGFRAALAEIESVPVTVTICNSSTVEPANFKKFIDSGNEILERLGSFDSERVMEEIALLKQAVVALLYRIEAQNGGLSSAEVSERHLSALVEKAEAWKSSQVAFNDSRLSRDDINILRDACQYREFAETILSSNTLLEKFFNWALRDRISIRAFIEFPSIAKKINDFGLNGRIGRINGQLLKVVWVERVQDGLLQKVVTLPFEGKEISILDEGRYVLLRGNYALTIGEVFEEFAKKLYGESNLEFMAEGVVNWNSFRWGWWNADAKEYELVDLNKEEWWKDLPILEILSLREAREKFGNHLDGRQWNVAAIATRERATLDFEGAHAYSSIAIPQGQGQYAVYPFGKFAKWFPSTLLEALLNIGQTTDATVAFPDENVFYTHRQRSRISFGLTESQGLAYLDSIKSDMLLSRAGNFSYQIESENCAKWAHEKIEQIVGPHRIPNVFQMPFLHSEPHGLMENVFGFVKSFPETWQIAVTLIIHFFLGAYKGVWVWEGGRRVWKSLTNHSFWNDTVIYHPSMLHRQQERQVIGRAVSLGVTFTKEHIHMSYHNLHHKMVVFGEYVSKGAERIFRAIIAFYEAHLTFRQKGKAEHIAFLSRALFSGSQNPGVLQAKRQRV